MTTLDEIKARSEAVERAVAAYGWRFLVAFVEDEEDAEFAVRPLADIPKLVAALEAVLAFVEERPGDTIYRDELENIIAATLGKNREGGGA